MSAWEDEVRGGKKTGKGANVMERTEEGKAGRGRKAT